MPPPGRRTHTRTDGQTDDIRLRSHWMDRSIKIKGGRFSRDTVGPSNGSDDSQSFVNKTSATGSARKHCRRQGRCEETAISGRSTRRQHRTIRGLRLEARAQRPRRDGVIERNPRRLKASQSATILLPGKRRLQLT